MGYVLFTTSSSRGNSVSIYKEGLIRISLMCYRKYFNDNKYVLFYYDKVNKRIGIRPIANPEEDSRILSVNKTGVSISCRLFFKHFEILIADKKICPCSWNIELNLLEVQLE